MCFSSEGEIPPYFLRHVCIERGIGNTQLTADLRHGRPRFSLLQGKNNLLFGESSFFHRHHLRSGSVDHAGILFLNGAGFRVRATNY